MDGKRLATPAPGSEPLETVGFADFETRHTEDLKADGLDVRLTKKGPSIFENDIDTSLPPEVWVKGGALVVWHRSTNSYDEIRNIHTIEDMLWAIYDTGCERVYFHNTRFDASFILDYFYKCGKWTQDGCYLKRGKNQRVWFKSVMQGRMNNLYSVKLAYTDKEEGRTDIQIWDSAKIWRQSLDDLGWDFGLHKGGTTGGSLALAVGWNDEIEEYCMQDCRVLAKVMVQYFDMCCEYSHGCAPNGFMTGAGTALYFGNMALREKCEKAVQALDEDSDFYKYLERQMDYHNKHKLDWKPEWEMSDALMHCVYLPKLKTTDNMRARVVDGQVTRDKEIVNMVRKVHKKLPSGKWATDDNGDYIYETDEEGNPLTEVVSGKAELSWIREGYKGSTPLLDKKRKFDPNGFVKDVLIKDVNSMFPTMIRWKALPYGKAKECTPEECMQMMDCKSAKWTWVAQLKVNLKVRKGHRATYILKDDTGVDEDGDSSKTLPLIDSDDPNTGIITICEPEWDMICRDYDVEHGYYEVIQARKFKTKVGLFDTFIDFWYKLKAQAGREKNKALKAFCKLILNSFYGKFGTNPYVESYEYYMVNGCLKTKLAKGESDMDMDLYLPLAMWTTAYARDTLSRGCNALGWDHVIYTDTDSWHIIGLTVEEVEERLGTVLISRDRVDEEGNMYCFMGNTDMLGDAKIEGWEDKNGVEHAFYPYGAYIRNKGYMHFDEERNIIWARHPKYENGILVRKGIKDIKMGGANNFDNINTMEDMDYRKWPTKDGKKVLMASRLTGYRVPGGILLMDTLVNVLEDCIVVESCGIYETYINTDNVIQV